MRRVVSSILLACLLTATATANAKGFHKHHRSHRTHHHRSHGHGRLPWCGIYMTQYFGIFKRSLWVAANWRFEGTNAGGPRVGAVVVWPHHVGVIRGGPDSAGRWLVHSGNDGNAVRTRYRSLRGAIAFREIGSHLARSSDDNLKIQQEASRGRHKHLASHTVRSRRHAARLRQASRAAALAILVPQSPSTFALTLPAKLTDEVARHQRQPMVERQRMINHRSVAGHVQRRAYEFLIV